MPEPVLEVATREAPAPPRDDADVLAEVTSHVTRYLAAQIIADPSFPKREKLPKPLPPPFCNFGHQLLVDYECLLRIVWQVALDARAAAMRTGFRRIPLITIAACAVWLLSLLSFDLLIITIAGILLAGALIAYRAHAKDAARKAMARVRANALEQLVEDCFEESGSMLLVEERHLGDGALGGPAVPVLTTLSNGTPFPGFGRLQAESLFVCRPKDDGQQQALVDLARLIHGRAVAKAAEQPDVVMRQGEVIVVHGGSLSTNSRWLGDDRAPLLWFPRTELGRVQNVDPRASVRIFQAIQMVMPSHATAATFFLRVFPAGNSIAFQISVTTLGPPAADLEGFLARLLQHKIEQRARWDQIPQRLWKGASPAGHDALRYLRLSRRASRSDSPFQDDIQVRELREVELIDERQRGRGFEQIFYEIVHDSPLWPGRIFDASVNLREERSLTFLTDFFGRPEAVAHVHTVYDQIVRTVLETIEEGGFDTSEYRDSSGKLLIQAAKIDQLVVGEKITMSKEPKEPQEPHGDKREAPKRKAA